jgi:hypothetical protein
MTRLSNLPSIAGLLAPVISVLRNTAPGIFKLESPHARWFQPNNPNAAHIGRRSHPESRLERVEIRLTAEEYLRKAKATTTDLEGIGRAASK